MLPNNSVEIFCICFIVDEIGFLTQPSNVLVNNIGNLALLDCNTTNFNTESSFVWTNGSDPVPLGSSPAVELNGDNNERLIINSVTIYDIANYTCHVTRTKTSQLITSVIALSVTGKMTSLHSSYSQLYGETRLNRSPLAIAIS